LLQKIYLFVVLLCLSLASFAQVDDNAQFDMDGEVDKVEYAKNLLTKAYKYFEENDNENAIKYSELAIKACEDVGMLNDISVMLLNLGELYRIEGNFTQALKYLYSSSESFKSLKNASGKGMALNLIGSIYRLQGDYSGALEHYFNALSLLEIAQDSIGMSSVLNNIGVLYFYQNNYPKALQYYMNSLNIGKKLGREYTVSISYMNIGEVYKKMGNYTEALDYFLKSLVLTKKYEGDDKEGDGVGVLYNEIGSIYIALGDYYLSESYLFKALAIFEKIGNHQRLAECKIYLGQLAFEHDSFSQAQSYFMQALNHAKTISAIDLCAESHKFLSEVYEKQGSIPMAFSHYKKYIAARDSIFNEDNMKRMVQAEMLYNFKKERHQTQIEQAKRDVIAYEKEKRQRLLRNFLLLVLGVALVGMLMVYIAYKNKQKANMKMASQQNLILEKNEELLQQQEEILAQRDEIEHKNRILEKSQRIIEANNDRIISSIEYAQTIQEAILPNPEQLGKLFPNHAVLFMPKDIVSGDFYWVSSVDNLLFAAVVDCTGHGVPGALMSVIGNTLLNQIVNEWRTYSPALALEIMHKQVRKVLKQDTTSNKGHITMDICLVAIDLKDNKATFAGACRPLFVVTNGRVQKIAGDPRSVGGFQREDRRYFTNHYIDISKPVTLYLTSDGYTDQMDDNFKKFGRRRFIELLHDIDGDTSEMQEQKLLNVLKQHQHGQDQIDDICVFGIKL